MSNMLPKQEHSAAIRTSSAKHVRELVDTMQRSLIKASLFIIVLWLTFGFLPMILSPDPPTASQFGDSFGFINSLFSGLALAGVVVAIFLQTLELAHQRQEIDDTQALLKESATAQERSYEALRDSATRLQEQAEALHLAAQTLKDQADSSFLAAYLNALASVISPPLTMNEEQAKRLRTMTTIVGLLELRAAHVLEHDLGEESVAFQMRRASEYIAAALKQAKAEWVTMKQQNDRSYEASIKSIRHFYSLFKLRDEKLGGYLAPRAVEITTLFNEILDNPPELIREGQFERHCSMVERLFELVERLVNLADQLAPPR